MSNNLKAASYAAQLDPAEKQRIDEFYKALEAHKTLSNLPGDIAKEAYNKKTPAQQASLKQNFGEEDPVVKPPRGFFGTAWHYTGGQIAEAAGDLLAGLQKVSDTSTRVARSIQLAADQGVGISDAWTLAKEDGNNVFSPGRISEAKSKWGTDAVDIAMRLQSGEAPESIIASVPEEQKKYIMLADSRNKQIPGFGSEEDVEAARANFQDTQDAVAAAKYSPGRFVANLVTPAQLEGSGFYYKAVSGTVDAAYRVFADPLLLAGKAKRTYDVSKYALEVVVGKSGNLTEYFSKQGTIDFWNLYGEKLQVLGKAEAAKNPEAIQAARQELQILAPEFGPAVIKSFQSAEIPVQNAETAKAFFENTKQLDEMIIGKPGMKRVIMPRMNVGRDIRVAAVTTGRKLLNLDRVGPKLTDDYWFGGASTADGIAEVFINGQKEFIERVTPKTNFKGIAKFSTAYIQYRIDRARAALTIAPIFEKEVFDVTAKDAMEKMYRTAILIMPRQQAKLFATAFESLSDVGKKKDAYYGLWATIAEIRGMNTTQPGQQIVRYLTGKTNAVFGGVDDLFPDKGAIPSDFNNYVAAPSIRDLDRAAARNTLFQKMMGLPNTNFANNMTSAWSFLTLAGPRYAIRNAGEDLMVNLAIGESAWGLAKNRILSTRINTFMAAVNKAEGVAKQGILDSANPLGIALRLINKRDVDRYAKELTDLQAKFETTRATIASLRKEIKELPITRRGNRAAEIAAKETQIKELEKSLAGGLTTQTREIFARALSEGRINNMRKSLGMGPMNKEEIELLTEQIKYGNIDNALGEVSESGANYALGNDYIARATNLAQQTGVKVHALEISAPGISLVKKPGERGYKFQAIDPGSTESMFTWLLSISRYSNDELGKIAIANLDDKVKALNNMRTWLQTKQGKQFLSDARLQNDMDAEGIINLAFNRAKDNFVKRDGEINLDLLNKVRVLDKSGNYKVEGKLSLDDLPDNYNEVPRGVIGPTLIPAVDPKEVTSNIMTNGWTFLGMANARISRQPMVLQEMVKIRREMRNSGFEDAWINSYTKGMDPENTTGIAIVTERAKVALATAVEERAVSQILQYVDNPLVRTQLAFGLRNFARFYRATEDFYRRMYRVVRYNPEALVKAALTYEGVTHSGWIQQDDQGEDYFIYPAIAPAYNAIQNTLESLGIKSEFKVPFPVEFGARVKMLTPSLNPDSMIPTFSGPIAGFSIGTVSSLVNIFDEGAADTIRGYALGKYSVDQPFLSLVLPAHINRAYAAMNQDDRNSQYASAWRKAVTYLEASGHGIPKEYDSAGNLIPPSAQDLENYRLKVKNTVIGILGMRFAFGFFAPASPQVQLKSDMAQWISDNGRANFKQTFNKLRDQYTNIDDAYAKWVELFPNQVPFTLTESERKGLAPLRYAEEAGQFVNENEQLFNDHPLAAGFLIPHKAGFSWDAYKSMRDLGLTQNKRVDDYLKEVQTAADLQAYYNKKDEFESALSTAVVDFQRTQLRKEFTAWKTIFFAGRPLAAEQLSQGGQTAFKRKDTLNDLNFMLSRNLNIAPKTEAKLREMSQTYQAYQDQRASYEQFGGSQQMIKMLKDQTIARLRELASYNENTQGAYDVLFGGLIGD
jgi:hypothetical protein